ncbi:MAG: amidase [Jannaschia sp.]
MNTRTDDLPGALDTAMLIADGALTAEAAVRQCLAVIDEFEPDLEAWVHVDAEGALDTARVLDRQSSRGPLHGVPIGIKDIFAVKDLPWRCGSPIWKDRIAGFDAGSVALARSAGAIVLGKTETTEFAGYTPTRTRNPRDRARTPGGSSSGSAAGVACGMMPLAFGTQTSGSIIRPASFCGVVGFKPSFDLVDTGGIAPFARSFDTVGVFARSVPDAAFGAAVLTGLDLQQDTATTPAEFAVYRSPVWDEGEAALHAAWTRFENDLGDRLREQVFDPEIEKMLAEASTLHARIMVTEAAEALAHEYAVAPGMLSPALSDQLTQGRAMGSHDRARDRRAMLDLRCRFQGLRPSDAVWLTPSAAGPAPLFETGTGSPAFNRIWSLIGLPCCSVPILQSADGLPIGVQVVGTPGNDRGVLTVANWLLTWFGSR